MRSAFVVTILLLFATSPTSAAQPLTLHDVMVSAFALAGIARTNADIANSRRVTRSAHAIPTLGIDTGYNRSMQRAGEPLETTTSELFSVDFGSPQGRIGRLLSARANADYAAAAFARTRLSVGQSVVAAFFTVAADEVSLQAAKESVDLATRSLRAAQERHRGGTAPLIDVQRAQAALEGAQADQAAAQAALATDDRSLGSVIGDTVTGSVSIPSLGPVPPDESVMAIAVATSPTVAAAQASLRVAEASLSVARGGLEPSLAVAAGPLMIREAGLASTGPSVTVAFTITIPAGSDRADVAAAEAQQLAAQTAYDVARRDAIRTALALRAQAAAAAARIPLLQAAYDNANRVAQTSLAGYRLGAISSADLIVAQTEAAAARSALASARVQAALANALLKLRIGESL
jgi:outer membrane protein TolC